MVRYLCGQYGISERHACRVVQVSRATVRYQARRPSQQALRQRIRDLAVSRVRYGYKRIHVLLRRAGLQVNHKRVHRLYCLEGLQLRARRPRRPVSAATRHPAREKRPHAPNMVWSMDFVTDRTVAGHPFRTLAVIDVFTRECLAVEPGHKFGAADVIRVLSTLAATRGAPRRISCDNGSEFAGRLVDLWAYANKVTLDFSRPGKPTDNAYIESFNGSFREECLNVHWFEDLTDARAKMQVWKQEYNEERPHRSLKNLTPLQYKAQWHTQRSENR